MRKLSGVSVVLIAGVALYFAAFWGLDALRVLTSPTYGLDDAWRAQTIFGIGSLFGLGPMGLIKLGAFIGILKLAVAIVCVLHVAARLRGWATGGAVRTEALDGGLILVALIGLASIVPAVLSQNSDLVREHLIHLAFAGLAMALCALERSQSNADEGAKAVAIPAGANSSWR